MGSADFGQHQVGRWTTLQTVLIPFRQQEMWLRMQAKSPAGRERAVEHIIGEVSRMYQMDGGC